MLCLGYYPHGSENISTLEHASDDFDLVTMAATSDAEVAKVFGVSFSKIFSGLQITITFQIERYGTYIFKQAMPGRLVEMDGEMNQESLYSFLENFGKPLVSDYTEVSKSRFSVLRRFRNTR